MEEGDPTAGSGGGTWAHWQVARIGMRGESGAEEMCLTDMWRANGSPKNQAPNDWTGSKQARELESFLRDSERPENSRSLISAETGKPPSTWAYWSLAFAYAKYLSPAWFTQTWKAALYTSPEHPRSNRVTVRSASGSRHPARHLGPAYRVTNQ